MIELLYTYFLNSRKKIKKHKPPYPFFLIQKNVDEKLPYPPTIVKKITFLVYSWRVELKIDQKYAIIECFNRFGFLMYRY